MKSNFLWRLALVLFLPISAVSADTHPDFPAGAYSMPDHEILVISDFGGSLKFFTQGGRTGTLEKTGKNTYEGIEQLSIQRGIKDLAEFAFGE